MLGIWDFEDSVNGYKKLFNTQMGLFDSLNVHKLNGEKDELKYRQNDR